MQLIKQPPYRALVCTNTNTNTMRKTNVAGKLTFLRVPCHIKVVFNYKYKHKYNNNTNK